jgi:hypothetical protein
VLLRLWESAEDERLDGVIAMDPFALAGMMRGTDPIQVEGLQTIDSNNAAKILLHDSYTELTQKQQTRALGQLVTRFWQRLQEGRVNSTALGQGLGDAVATQHFKLFTRDQRTQEKLETLESTGDYEHYGSNVQMVWHNSRSVSKVDYFLERRIQTVIKLEADGAAVIDTSVLITNGAPDSPPSNLLGGRDRGYSTGENKLDFNILLPERAEVRTINNQPGLGAATIVEDETHPVVFQRFDLLSGEQDLRTLSYSAPDVAEISDVGGHFAFTLFPQAMVNSDSFEIFVDAPAGYTLRRVGSFDEPVTRWTTQGVLDRPTTIELEILGD